MEASPDEQRLLTALTTEHFTLQGSRGSTVSESAARSTIYLGSVSSTLIGLGFFANISSTGDAFRVFALTALPTVFVLGVFTYIRLVQSSVEDLFYGRAINRIRHYYLELAGERGRPYFLLSGHDDNLGVIHNMAVEASRWQLYFTNAMAIAIVNAVIGGGAVALAVGVATGGPLGVATAIGGAFAIAYIARALHWERGYHAASAARIETRFPSP